MLSQANLSFSNQRDFTNFLEDRLLAGIAEPVVFGFDEADRLLGRPYQSDFFSMLRLWHNERARPASPWEKVDLALVIATEPYLLIAEADRSPFNVTPPIELHPFTRDELDVINTAHTGLLDASQLDKLHSLLSGHPYLTRLAYYRLLSWPKYDFTQLITRAADDDGPFGEHLRSRLFRLQRHPSLLAAMRDVGSGMKRLNGELYYRLHGAGLIIRQHGEVIPANRLYAQFFSQLL